MPITNFPDYASGISNLLNSLETTGQAKLINLEVDQRSILRGLIHGLIIFEDDSELHFREFVDTSLPEPKLSFAYQCIDVHKNLIFRYDNAAHRPSLSQPSHKHNPKGIDICPIPNLLQAVDEIMRKGEEPLKSLS